MTEPNLAEKDLQETFAWTRSGYYETYNTIVGKYQAKAVLEYAKGDSLLDVPCGDGTLTSFLVPSFKRVVGVDASSSHLAEARVRLPNVEFHEALLEDFQTEDRFDTISMINVLEHLVDPVHALKHMAQFLAPGGVMIIHVPNAVAINRRLAVKMGTLIECEELSPFDIQVAGHRRSYTSQTLRADIERAGLKIRDTGGVFYKMLSTPQMDWLLKNGPWEGFGWGRIGAEPRDWAAEFCRACYEIGKEQPDDCNIVFAVVEK